MPKWIDKINSPKDLQAVPIEKLPEVAQEYRQFLIESVAETGGHLGASLGALEFTMALHYVLNSPEDKICWDVGHQAYVHKMITGRRDRMKTMRKTGGLSGFPSPEESEHDAFTVGHAGTAISQALGLACARDLRGGKQKVVAVAGDGAMTCGLSYEALNNAGHLKKDMLIILNDNKMSISKNVGAISRYLNDIITNPFYNRVRREVERQVEKFPRLRRLAANSLEGMKHLFIPGLLFEELGCRYFGPVDGHDIVNLVLTLRKVLALPGCSLLHLVTQKGKGCDFAERDDEKCHGVTPFDIKTGEKLKGPEELEKNGRLGISYTKAVIEALIRCAEKDKRIVAVTAAMPSGTGLCEFQKRFPDRFFDVGIAEEHAVTFAGALAKGGMRPVCAVYSTFLQRAHDQILHDVALQRLPLVLLMDRSGLVGADGATHHGIFDISYLGHVPNAVIAAPLSQNEIARMLELAFEYPHVFALRYPRGNVQGLFEALDCPPFAIGEGQILCEGRDGALLALGTMVETALAARALLLREGLDLRVVHMRFAKPLDEKILLDCAARNYPLFTLEEHVLTGGFGSKVLEFFEQSGLSEVRLHRFGLPDEFIEHGKPELYFERHGLCAEKIAERVACEIRRKHLVPFSPALET
ncbi:MAG: 1-deoxy-D-xylulose-5-phosphate synthase [Candidatus Omnitrophota bacterium]|jgi:1-deoxy-D-xylulose-5-phosphate synthase